MLAFSLLLELGAIQDGFIWGNTKWKAEKIIQCLFNCHSSFSICFININNL